MFAKHSRSEQKKIYPAYHTARKGPHAMGIGHPTYHVILAHTTNLLEDVGNSMHKLKTFNYTYPMKLNSFSFFAHLMNYS